MNLIFSFTCLPSVLWIYKTVEYVYIGLKNWMKHVVPYTLRIIGMIDVIQISFIIFWNILLHIFYIKTFFIILLTFLTICNWSFSIDPHSSNRFILLQNWKELQRIFLTSVYWASMNLIARTITYNLYYQVRTHNNSYSKNFLLKTNKVEPFVQENWLKGFICKYL